MSNEYTLTGDFTLPSQGKVYVANVNPNVTLRSMTTADEMRRLNPSDRPFQTMASIIDDCLVVKPGISAYDMCLADYQFLLFRLREVTYGSNYELSTVCPYCGSTNSGSINLGQFEVINYYDGLMSLLEVDLPVTKKHVSLRMQTPRIMDDVSIRSKDIRKKAKDIGDPAFLLSLTALVRAVDGVAIDPIQAEDFVRNLPMKDTNKLISAIDKFNEGIGFKTELTTTCDICGLDYNSPFRISGDFFRPEDDE